MKDELDPEIASIIGSRISDIGTDGERMYWLLDNGRTLTFEGQFDVYLSERTLQ